MHLRIALPLALSTTAAAQPPSPIVTPRTAPRAEYVLVSGVTGTLPSNRHWSPAVSHGDTMYVFGGRTGEGGGGTRRNDLYSFDATTLTWTQHNADGDANAPSQRFRNAAAWDPVRDVLVIFGGEDAAGTTLNDTWEWDAATNTWTDVTALVSTPPSARRFSAMAWDPITQGMILHGGQDASGARDDTWGYFGPAGGGWAQFTPPTSPGLRANHSLVTRFDRGDIFLCAGHDVGATPNRIHYTDAWRWNPLTLDWEQIVTSTNAVNASMAGNQAVYDPIRQRVVLTGGQGISTNAAATGGAYGTEYGGSPTNWTSEFDCITNEWKLYGATTFGASDSVIGRASRYYTGFLNGKVYKWGGQNPAGGNESSVKEYQANPIADSTPIGAGCDNSLTFPVTLAPRAIQAGSGTTPSRPWLGSAYEFTTDGLVAGSLSATLVGFTTAPAPIPLNLVFPASNPCDLLIDAAVATIPLTIVGGSADAALSLGDDTALLTLTVNLQTVQVEGALTWVSASNMLQLQIGVN